MQENKRAARGAKGAKTTGRNALGTHNAWLCASGDASKQSGRES